MQIAELSTYLVDTTLVERWFAELTTKQIRRGAHRSVSELERAIGDFLDAHNADPKPFIWTKGADQIRGRPQLLRALLVKLVKNCRRGSLLESY